ncbi:calmodulin-dependent protein kinase [Aureococcus anophagefferens]|nr:calmodulin-dependent protein kinase [Aureococcus anophagefferens]
MAGSAGATTWTSYLWSRKDEDITVEVSLWHTSSTTVHTGDDDNESDFVMVRNAIDDDFVNLKAIKANRGTTLAAMIIGFFPTVGYWEARAKNNPFMKENDDYDEEIPCHFGCDLEFIAAAMSIAVGGLMLAYTRVAVEKNYAKPPTTDAPPKEGPRRGHRGDAGRSGLQRSSAGFFRRRAPTPRVAMALAMIGGLRSAIGSKMAQLKAAAGDAQRRDDGYVSFGDLELGERIGVGAFASVYAATSLSTRRKYAVKVVALRGGGRNAAKDAALLRAEGRMLRTLHHPSVISCYDVVDDPGERSSIVLELCEGGELLERIVESANHHFSEAGARQAARTLLSAVAHIHDHAICHCDLKPENLLLKSKSTDYDCKVADFGLAKVLKGPNALGLASIQGTDEYMAPEVLALERTKGAPRYGLKADAWGLRRDRASSRGSEDVGPAARSPPKTALVGRSELQSFRDSRRASDAARRPPRRPSFRGETGGPAPLHLDMSGIKPSPPSSPADRPPPDHRRLWRKGGGGSTPPGSPNDAPPPDHAKQHLSSPDSVTESDAGSEPRSA